MKKNIIYIMLIVILLLSFGIIFDVQAEDVQMKVNNSISKTGDSNSKLVTNEGKKMSISDAIRSDTDWDLLHKADLEYERNFWENKGRETVLAEGKE